MCGFQYREEIRITTVFDISSISATLSVFRKKNPKKFRSSIFFNNDFPIFTILETLLVTSGATNASSRRGDENRSRAGSENKWDWNRPMVKFDVEKVSMKVDG